MRPVTVTSDNGPKFTYQRAEDVWGEVNIKTGGESLTEQNVKSSLTYDIEIRYRRDVSSDWQIEYKGQTLDIIAAYDPDQRCRKLKIQAVKHGG